MYSWGWQLNDLLLWEYWNDNVFQVNTKCQPNSYHSNDKGNGIGVNQMNIQLMQLICTKVLSSQTCGLWCPSRDFFSAVGKKKISHLSKLLLWKFHHGIYLFPKSLWRWVFQPVGKAWPHFFGGKQQLSVSCFLMFLSHADKSFYLIYSWYPWKFPV